jgi:hypothetical protein
MAIKILLARAIIWPLRSAQINMWTEKALLPLANSRVGIRSTPGIIAFFQDFSALPILPSWS